MNKIPIMYTPEQMDEILDYIHETFGEGGDYVVHEIKSEFVHTDIEIITPEDEAKTYVTFGMGARDMNSPIEEWKRTELVMSASEQFDTRSKEGLIIAGELTRLSKFPFRNKTWFGPGHTINASDEFQEAFGYDYFIFFNPNLFTEITDTGKVNFLVAVPIYKDERKWITEHDSFDFLEALCDKFGGDILSADAGRAHFIPG